MFCWILTTGTVVEMTENAASLYGQGLGRNHVCLLVKFAAGSVSVDGKSNDASLLQNLLSELTAALSEPLA